MIRWRGPRRAGRGFWLPILLALLAWSARTAPAQEPAPTDITPTDVGAAGATSADATTTNSAAPRAESPAGHSRHGAWFNEGPRQRAARMENVGPAQWSITTNVPEAQAFFDQGLNQLHGFWWFEAERSFREVLALDPQAALGYWGMAVANWEHAPRSRALFVEALRRQEQASPRERQWIAAWARWRGVDPAAPLPPTTDFEPPPTTTPEGKPERPTKDQWQRLIRDLEDLIHVEPGDLEPKAWLAWAIWEASREDLPITAHEPVAALLEQVLAIEPRHHGAHHYLIHLWDRQQAARALPAAALCGPSAPGIAHCWHMSGHIYDQLKRYADAAWQQEASARVDHAYQARERVMPYLIHNYAHNQEWLTRSLGHVGRPRAALAFADNLRELPRHPKFNRLDEASSAAGYGLRRTLELIVKFDDWEELARRDEALAADVLGDPASEGWLAWARGLAASARGDRSALGEQTARLAALIAQTSPPTPPEAAPTAPATEGSPLANTAPALADSPPPPAQSPAEPPAESVDKKLRETREGLEKLHRELVVQQAWSEGRAADVAAETDRLDVAARARLASLALAQGQADKACEWVEKALAEHPSQVAPLARAVDVLARANRRDQAREHFEILRALAGEAELDNPLLARLAPWAAELAGSADWRVPASPPTDLGPRPPLDSLGPPLWAPAAAPAWELANAAGKPLKLDDYRGRPVLLIFYLGVSCLHCVEQLEKFAPRASEFEAQGISLVGISSETPTQLQAAEARFLGSDGAAFPIPLLADENRVAFRAYRAYDDFEDEPLHATVLVDAQGWIRWQDVSYEPFTEVDFLLGEARRILARPVSEAPLAAPAAGATSSAAD